MSIGLALPLRYLCGGRQTGAAAGFLEAFGEPHDCLALLEEHSITSIEIGSFGLDAPGEDLLAAAKFVVDAGMHLSLHSHLVGSADWSGLDSAYPTHGPVLDFLKEHGEATVMVVHAHSDGSASAEVLGESTARTLEQLAESIRSGDMSLRVALEISRYHQGIHDPSTTYEGLLDMTKGLEGSEVGFCWDIGHTQSSVLQNKLPAEPPPEFVKKVIHAHVHGLGPDGNTHWPLTESSSHIASGVSQLRSFGYGGTYVLELYPMRWETENAVRDGILDSILCLREILNRTQEDIGTDSDSAGPAHPLGRAIAPQ